jgi:hypothetical protein
MNNTLPFRGLPHWTPRVSSRVKRNLSFTRQSLSIHSLLFYQRNVRPSVDLFTVPLNSVPIKARYQPIAPDCLLPHDSLIAPPRNSQCYVQSQGFGAHHHGYPKEPPNTAMGYNASVQSHSQSFTSSAYELAMPHCFPLLMNSALNRTSTSLDVPSSASHINPSHFHLSHPPPTTSAPLPQAPSSTATDTLDPSTSVIAHSNADASVASSSRAGPSRNTSSGVIACRQWCVIALSVLTEKALLPSLSVSDGVFSRSRKIRCDSTRPNCQNCIKRGNECLYDKVPKRRGPDKRPGTRKRSCKKRQSDGSDSQPKKKRRADTADQGSNIAHASYSEYEISSVAMPMFGPAHQRANEVHSEPPTASLHEAYYVKVGSPLPFLALPTLSSPWVTPGSPKRPPSPTSTQAPSTSRRFKSEIQPGQPFVHPFESDPRSPEQSSYEDTSPPLVHTPAAQYSRRMCQWWDELLDDYSGSSTRDQVYVAHPFHHN